MTETLSNNSAKKRFSRFALSGISLTHLTHRQGRADGQYVKKMPRSRMKILSSTGIDEMSGSYRLAVRRCKLTSA